MALLDIVPCAEEEALTVHQSLTPVQQVLLGGNGRLALFTAVDVTAVRVDYEEFAHSSQELPPLAT